MGQASALLRGEVAPGERCELVGVGPIPVAAVKDLIASGDVFLAAVIKHMKQVIGVTHFGRKPTAFEVTALEFMNPRCVVEGCDTTYLEHDHEEDWYLTKQTSLAGIEPMCPPDHKLKTHNGYRLVKGTGRRALVPPGQPDHPGNPQYHPRRNKPTQ